MKAGILLGSAVLASAALLIPAAGPALAASPSYTNVGGSAQIATKFGAFGPSLQPGEASLTAADGQVTALQFQAQPIPNGTMTSYVSWSNFAVSLSSTSTTGSISAAQATVSETGLEMDLTGTLSITVDGYVYSNTFTSAAPLKIYLSPTPTENTASTVTATGNVQANGSFDLTGSAYANVDSSTWTGWALGKLINGDAFNLSLAMAPTTPNPS